MVKNPLLVCFVIMIVLAMLSGCTTSENPRTPTNSPGPSEVIPEASATLSPTPQVGTPPDTPVQTTCKNIQIFKKNDLVYWDDYKTYPFDSFNYQGSEYQQAGEVYTVKIKADIPLTVYVLPTNEIPLLNSKDRRPTYDAAKDKIDFHGLAPVAVLYLAYDASSTFTIPKMGKYTLVVDPRFSEMNLQTDMRESFKYEIEALKVEGDNCVNTEFPSSETGNGIVVLDVKDVLKTSQYKLYKFEELVNPAADLTFQNPGECFSIDIHAEKPVLVYILSYNELPKIEVRSYAPTYDKARDEFEFSGYKPVQNLGLIYDGGGVFTVKEFGKYVLVIDSRQTERDLTLLGETIKYQLHMVKLDNC